MDLWVVAAAAGAGYIAKNLQNLSVDKKESLGGLSYKYSYNVQSESRNFLQQLRDKTCPLRRLARKKAQGDAFLEVENHSDVDFSEIDSLSNRDKEAGAASTSGDALEKNGVLEDYNMGWISSLPSVFSAEETLEFEDGENRNVSRVNRGKFIGSRRCRVHSMRPLNSLGSCLDAQLCREHENMEDNTCLYPSMPTVRPVLVTDGSQINSRSGSNSSFAQFEGCREEARRETGTNIMSSSSLEQFESVEGIRKPKKCSGNLQLSGSSDGVFGRLFHSQGPDTKLLFITGMTVGILSATTAWKNELDKLNKQLKQMQTLVQDLHEELDMKEMLMVKELTDEGYVIPGENDTPLLIQEPIASPFDVKVNKLTKLDSLKANDKNTENLELLSKIEAELQAELEMLEHNLRASALERISSVVELDPDIEPDIVQGDLKSTIINGESESGNETTDTTTNCYQPVNYAVSPWELSLRLHELIESRLETHIKELEIALGSSQNRVQFLGSQSIFSGRRFPYSETESSSTHHYPTCICDEHAKREDVPSAENFSSNYVDAYKEPNGILLRVTDKDQENEVGESSSKAVDQGKHPIDEIWNGEYDSISHHSVIMEEDRSLDLVEDMPEIGDKQRSKSFMPNEDCVSEDEGTDESEMLLIKQIVERRKSGSSFNLKID
ncbi:hypothetical protein Pfo_023908 [Paulownia fortunei]|nr:hypothetical protein Pfo_023908 [Paulownia fortunei]